MKPTHSPFLNPSPGTFDSQFGCWRSTPHSLPLPVLALAIGIGVNTAVVTAYKALALQRLDARDPQQQVNIYRSTSQYRYQTAFSYPDFEFYRDENHVFSGVVATAGYGLALTGGDHAGSPESSFANALTRAAGFRFPSVMRGGAEFVSALGVSVNYFSVLGVNAIRERVLLPQESDPVSAWLYNFGKGGQSLNRHSDGKKQMALSVRCVRE
jgi:hypothetical protein